MKTGTIVLFFCIITWAGQNKKEKERIETIRQLVSDLKTGRSNEDIFKAYLESGGRFEDDKTKTAAGEWMHLLRESVKSSDVAKMEIYKYTERPEKGRVVKKVDEEDSGVTAQAPLEFELHSLDNQVSNVDPDNLYVLRLHDQRVFVLFNRDLKMITYFALTWGHKVELVKF